MATTTCACRHPVHSGDCTEMVADTNLHCPCPGSDEQPTIGVTQSRHHEGVTLPRRIAFMRNVNGNNALPSFVEQSRRVVEEAQDLARLDTDELREQGLAHSHFLEAILNLVFAAKMIRREMLRAMLLRRHR